LLSGFSYVIHKVVDLESWNSISRKANFNIIYCTQVDIFHVI